MEVVQPSRIIYPSCGIGCETSASDPNVHGSTEGAATLYGRGDTSNSLLSELFSVMMEALREVYLPSFLRYTAISEQIVGADC